MAFVTRKITRTSQPQELVGIDWRFVALRAVLPSMKSHDVVCGKPLITGVNVLYENGQVGTSFKASGNYNKITTGEEESTILGLSESFATINVFKLNTIGINQVIFSTMNSSGFDGISVRARDSGNIEIGMRNVVLSPVVMSASLGVWYTVVTQFVSGKSLSIWINGSDGSRYFNVVTTTATTRFPTNGPFTWLWFGAYPHPFWTTNANLALGALLYGDYTTQAVQLADNPWQIFEPIEETIWIPDGVSVTLPTLVQPVSTTSAGTWAPTGAATLHEAIDEVTPSDADYISVTAASTCELVLAESAFPTGNVSLAYRALSSTASTLTVTLKQGSTTIMTRTHALTGTATLYTQALTAGEVAAIVAGPITCTLTSS